MPSGFICGFPTGNGGDLYGGNTYLRTAGRAPTDLQTAAQAAAAARWGEGPPGREQISHPVCKGKFQPWRRDGEMFVRAYGCFRHHAVRAARIKRAGLREGWESFEQWAPPYCYWDAVRLVMRGQESEEYPAVQLKLCRYEPVEHADAA